MKFNKPSAFTGPGLGLLVLLAIIMTLAVATPAQAGRSGIIKIGVLEEPKSLNLWLAGDAWSRRVLNLIYQPLYLREPKHQRLVPWLAAAQPSYDPATISYTVKLRPAKWSDGSDFTAADVVFTGHLIQRFRIPRHNSRWKFIKKVEALDAHTVRFVLKRPKATFLTRTLTTPIVQKKQWQAIVKTTEGAQKPLTRLLRYDIKKPVGTGPFMLSRWKKGVYVFMLRNPHFFGHGHQIAGFTLGPYLKGIIFKVFGTADAAVLALRKGTIDMYWNGIQPGYLEDLRGDPAIKLYVNKKSALYFMGFNLRKAPFNDVHFRRAVATLISKRFIIERILQSYGSVLDSIVPPGNKFYCNPDVPVYGRGLDRKQRIRKAYQILKQAGYSWQVPPVDAAGRVQPGKGLKDPSGRLVPEFTILTPPADYDPHRAMSGQMIQEWLRALGIPAYSRPMAFGALIQKIKGQRDFDCFILGYAKLSLDPGYLRAFFHSRGDKPQGWNMSGYRNPVFDKLAEASDNELDPEKRRQIIFKLQEILMRDVPYIPLYNPLLVEGVRKDRFTGWVPAVGGIGNIWSFCTLKPR